MNNEDGHHPHPWDDMEEDCDHEDNCGHGICHCLGEF